MERAACPDHGASAATIGRARTSGDAATDPGSGLAPTRRHDCPADPARNSDGASTARHIRRCFARVRWRIRRSRSS